MRGYYNRQRRKYYIILLNKYDETEKDIGLKRSVRCTAIIIVLYIKYYVQYYDNDIVLISRYS